MKKQWMLSGLLITAILSGCSSNRLHEYTLQHNRAAAVMAPAPRAEVFTFGEIDLGGNPLRALVRAGTTIAKEIQAGEAQKKLDAAMDSVDIPEIIRFETLEGCCRHLEMRTVEDRESADFVYLLRIKRYGIDAESWNAQVDFRIDVHVRMIDNASKRKVWERTIRERMPVSRSIFGFNDLVGDVLTASALSELSETEMAQGFTHLAGYAAGRISDRIFDDFIKSRERVE